MLSEINLGRVVLTVIAIFAVLLAIGMSISFRQSGYSGDVADIGGELTKLFPARPYTTASTPAYVAARVVETNRLPQSWSTLISGNNYSTPWGGTWTVYVDSSGYLDLVMTSLKQSDCLGIAQGMVQLPRLQFVSIATNGSDATTGQVSFQSTNDNQFNAAIGDLAQSSCLSGATNQMTLTFF